MCRPYTTLEGPSIRTDRTPRKSIRLPEFDYTAANHYFVTLCTWKREHLFGKSVGSKVILGDIGNAVSAYWLKIPEFHPDASLDEFVVMPNHLHGIIILSGENFGKDNRSSGLKPKSLGSILGSFKSSLTKSVNHDVRFQGNPVWQRGYYERIIRNQVELEAVREYIRQNPGKWAEDEENV